MTKPHSVKAPWETFSGRESPCLRIETEETFFLVPYVDLIKATLNEAQNHLTLFFNSLDVTIRGGGLLPLLLECQKFRVEVIRAGAADGGTKQSRIDRVIVNEAPMETKGGSPSTI